MSFRLFALFFWIAVIAILVYLYFYQPEILQHIFSYPGAGSPYVNPPGG